MKTTSRCVLTAHALSAVAVLALPTACSGEAYEGEHDISADIGAHEQAILNGQASSLDNVVRVFRNNATGRGLCTGTLLRNDIVLTAKHCVGTADGGQFRKHSIRTPSGETSNISNLSQIVEHSGADVAVLRLDNPVTFAGSDFYSMTELYDGSVNSLVNDQVLCVGYGIKTCGGNDSGSQRSATLTIKSASSTSLVYEPNAQGQLLSSGDSGGPCFQSGKVVGTTRTAGCSEAKQVPMPSNAQWIRDTLEDLIDSRPFQSPTVRTSLAQFTPIRHFANSTDSKRQFCNEQGYADADAAESRASRPAGTVVATWDSATGDWKAERLNLPVGVYETIVCRN